ncbi:Low molecular weight phosphatase family protein [Klebsormidium nitens]|uniref:Low molecular weight phosphatase family protein n=1 Tax=Klebsormidium nitens TaxID=105231 RepID=A0A1Y1HQH3_KLENI|nr:Low molecular weight phosphatase family protein [Klebsormidium nitens]|eukprot:GAQ78817.1 Low molecular weight phosphatase family protein [Klebsormidium nitens]
MASSLLVRNAQGAFCRASCSFSSLKNPDERVSSDSCQWLSWVGEANAVRRGQGAKGQRRCPRSFAVGQLHRGGVVSMQSAQAETSETVEEPQRAFDVSSNCVTPSFRSAPWQGTNNERETDSAKANILFLSEGNVCRSIYAEAMFNGMLAERGLDNVVACASKATKDYNVGEPPDPRAVQVAEELGIRLREGATARLIDHAKDIVQYDLILCFDKFNAADVLKEISVYDTIDSTGRYSVRVRRLGEFARSRAIEEVDDPLYGNMGGADEFENLRQCARDVWDCCEGLADKLQEMYQELPEGESLQGAIAQSLAGMETFDWLVPPMLQKREKASSI